MRKSILILTLSCSLAIGCTKATSSDAQRGAHIAFELPQIPDTLTDPQSRAEYLSYHYWDNVDFADKSVANDTAMLEQAFVDYIDMLRIVDESSTVDRSIGILIDRSYADEDAARLMSDLASKYLYETESPMLDEDCYLRFLNIYLTKADDEASRLRIEDKISNIARNRVGTPMPDLDLLGYDGSRLPLSGISSGKPSIIIIYDNDCSYCHDVIDEMVSDPRLNEVLDAGKLSVVAIDLGLKSSHLPLTDKPNWFWTWADDDIDAEIAFRDTPSVYLVGADGNILIKDASYDYVCRAIFH